jgi:hypothetical protein
MLRLKLKDGTNCIDAHPEEETLLVTRDNRTELMRKVLDWLREVVNGDPCSESSRYLR